MISSFQNKASDCQGDCSNYIFQRKFKTCPEFGLKVPAEVGFSTWQESTDPREAEGIAFLDTYLTHLLV